MQKVTTIQDLANEYLQSFERITRDADGARIWTCKDSAPQVIADMVFEAHDSGYILPDDYRYAFVVDSLDTIADADADADLGELEELAYEIEADVYTADLIRWMGSRADRYSWVDEVRDNLEMRGDSVIEEIREGQAEEMRHVYRIVLEFLAAVIEDLEDAEDIEEEEN